MTINPSPPLPLKPMPTKRVLYFVGPWDLNRELPCIPKSPSDGTVVLIESRAKSRALPYHKQKLVLVLSAMHRFAEQMRALGYRVLIHNAKTYLDGLRELVALEKSEFVVACAPREWGIYQKFLEAHRTKSLGCSLELRDDGGDDSHFLLTRRECRAWVQDEFKEHGSLRMDRFYRWMRKKTGYLMEGGKPAGGKLSYDAENRKKPPKEIRPLPRPTHTPSDIVRETRERIAGWKRGFGSLGSFNWPTTREEALEEMNAFFEHRANLFGDYQDAMIEGEPFLWHTCISSSLNLSLLSPREVCDRIQDEWQAGRMPLAAAEGLLRQILGWREYVRAVYWNRMPQMREANALKAKRKLPVFYWEPERTKMACMHAATKQVHDHGYAHHIQRLMVLGNFALLASVDPIEISHWFWAAFVDAYEWVELPNVHGMAVYADTSFTTKPYAASGAYINKMSDHCKGCEYDVKLRSGETSCPFNSLYWSFLERHQELFRANARMPFAYANWDRFPEQQQAEILATAESILRKLDEESDGFASDWTYHNDRFHDDDG